MTNFNPEYDFWMIVIIVCLVPVCATIVYWIADFLEARRVKRIFERKNERMD